MEGQLLLFLCDMMEVEKVVSFSTNQSLASCLDGEEQLKHIIIPKSVAPNIIIDFHMQVGFFTSKFLVVSHLSLKYEHDHLPASFVMF